MREITVGIRSGDTPADERRRLARTPPDILITTPESLYLMLTSKMRDTLRGVDTVIVDEVHAVAGGKRGAHLSISLERLDELLDHPAQRIGLSATVRPVEEVARFLGGTHDVTVVRPPSDKPIELQVVVPVEDLAAIDEAPTTPESSTGAPVRASVWPHVEERILDLVCSHRSTIVFANSRRLAERLCARLNELHTERVTGLTLPTEGSLAPAVVMASGSSRGADPGLEIARAHHGSVSREQRARIEDDLKSGRLPAVVATSSLELGIDMGAVDLVIQVEAPPSVASGLQRVGRAEHRVDGVSRGIVFPKHRGDLVNTAVVAERMRSGAIEELFVPRHPLDVLAQQIVAMVAMDDWDVDAIGAVVRRAAPFSALPSSALDAVLDMLSGRYPSDAFAELRPRLVWDREANTLTARPGSQRLAVVNGGTIPDRGQYGVFLAAGDGPGRRVGELDEEMVYESRIGDVFALGATSWRIDDITHDRVLVTPATGQPGRLPFWHGDTIGRPAELGRAIGAFIRDVGTTPRDKTEARLLDTGLDLWATSNLLAYLDEQRDATGHLPDDRTIVVERFRDEIGDWRIAVHSPLGGRVHTPWALAMSRRIHDELGIDVQVMPSDDGIVLRLPDVEIGLNEAPSVLPYLALDPDDVQRAVTEAVAGSALFAARFRECAARSLLLPRRRPDRRTPLWQQRQRAAQLLGVASEHATFPIVLETMREVVQDVFDVPALTDLMTRIASGEVRVVEVETATPSPFARSLLFGYVGAFLYEGDAPLAERRAQALALDPSLLAELLGQAELRELLDADALDQVERELQRLTPERAARDLEDVADLLRVLGPLTGDELATRGCADAWVGELVAARRAVVVRIDGQPWFAGVEDVGRLRDALGTAPPMGVSAAFLEPVADPVGDLVSRYARTHGPFTPQSVADRFGLGVAVVTTTLQRLAVTGRVVSGEFRPQGTGLEWCDTQVLRLIRRRSLAALRREAEPVAAQTLGRFLPQWQGIGGRSRLLGVEGLLATVEQLRGALVPASVLERMVLPARVSGYSPAMLDELTTSGEVIWSGHGGLPGGDGWVALHLADDADLLLAQPEAPDTLDPAAQTVLEALDGGTALFFRDLVARVGQPEPEVAELLWALVWSGWVGNDTFAPVRARLQTAAQRRPPRPSARYARRPGLPRRAAPQGLPGRWARLPERSTDLTRRAHAAASALIERHGVVTRGASVAERTPGGFAATYRVLAAFEEAGRARRGYFVEGLGAAQFAVPGAVDRLRDVASQQEPTALVLAATDPANPYGAALPWPRREGHQPGRKAGAVVVLVEGDLVLYVERGGRSLLSWSDQDAVLTRAVDALAQALREGWLGRLTVERADGDAALSSPLGVALQRAGFHATPRGLRLHP
ncbi:MAG: ATP-dependent helicase [Actinomycetes bacterium]